MLCARAVPELFGARAPVAPARAHARLPAGATHVSASTICTPSRATRQPVRSREPSGDSLQRKALGWGCTGPILLQTLRPQCADTQCLMLYLCMRLGLVQTPWHTHNPVARHACAYRAFSKVSKESVFQDPVDQRPTHNGTRSVTMPQLMTRQREPTGMTPAGRLQAGGEDLQRQSKPTRPRWGNRLRLGAVEPQYTELVPVGVACKRSPRLGFLQRCAEATVVSSLSADPGRVPILPTPEVASVRAGSILVTVSVSIIGMARILA